MRRSPGSSQAAAELARWRRLLTAAICLTVPVFIIARILPHFPAVAAGLDVMLFGFPVDELLKWLLTTPIQVRLPGMRLRPTRQRRCLPSVVLLLAMTSLRCTVLATAIKEADLHVHRGV